jgi:hypothetical protein
MALAKRDGARNHRLARLGPAFFGRKKKMTA